eukprot:7570815-Alexandrium_andersonii.AAC.1
MPSGLCTSGTQPYRRECLHATATAPKRTTTCRNKYELMNSWCPVTLCLPVIERMPTCNRSCARMLW